MRDIRPPILLRPGHLHTPTKVLSCTEESGLTVKAPVPATGNNGYLRLRTSGKPTGVVDRVVRLMTGGNPVGYASADYGAGAGAQAIHRASTYTDSQYEGYVDTPYMTDVQFPLAYVNSAVSCSTPRQLADGYLGFLYCRASGSGGLRFCRVAPDGTSSNALVFNTSGVAIGTAVRVDFVVLPSGRLVAFGATQTGYIVSRYSDDNGATWEVLSQVVCAQSMTADTVLCAEYSEDAIVLVFGSATGITATRVWVSLDGGCTATLVDEDSTLIGPRTCITKTGKLLVTSRDATNTSVYPVNVGGGIDAESIITSVVPSWGGEHPIVCRDDGTLFIFGLESTAANADSARLAVSVDGGETWSDAAGSQPVFDSLYTAGLTITKVSCGMWRGSVVMLATVASPAGSDHSVMLITWGEYANVTEKRKEISSNGQPYEFSLLAVDSPTSIGWFPVVVGAGSTITNQNELQFVTNINDYTYWNAPAAILGASAAESSRRVRKKIKVNSGGSKLADHIFMRLSLVDGAGNRQGFKIRYLTTGFIIHDTAGNLLVDVTVDLTTVTRFLFAFKHDASPGVSGALSVWYRKSGDVRWTEAIANAACVDEPSAEANRLLFGTNAAAATDYKLWYLNVAHDDNDMAAGFTNPDDLYGRPLTAASDFYLVDGVNVGGRNGGGVPGDIYTVQTTYQYPKEALWSELRPSRQLRSQSDDQDWDVRFYSGASDTLKASCFMLFGTNYRTATFQMHTSDSWATPSVEVQLDATVATFAASAVGPGYIGPAASLRWRPGQFKSDGDAHRWFVEVTDGASSSVYEITDNDADRLYIDGVDLSGIAAGEQIYIFGDRMAVELPGVLMLQYARLFVPQQVTADGHYRTGTPLFDIPYTPGSRWSFGFVDRTEPNTTLTEADTGHRASARIGPRRGTLAVQWDPLDRDGDGGATEEAIADFYAAVEGGHVVFGLWRDRSVPNDVYLMRFKGTLARTNVWGEGRNRHQLTRVEQIILEEEF